MSPLCETYIEARQLNHAEIFYPLHVHVCERCFLVQLDEYVGAEQIFGDYAYFSSYSESWIEHARRYTESVIARFGLGEGSFVMEIASNDGYLLQHFVTRRNPLPRHRAGGERCKGRHRARHPTASASSALRPPRTLPVSTAVPTSSSATTSSPTFRTSTISSPG